MAETRFAKPPSLVEEDVIVPKLNEKPEVKEFDLGQDKTDFDYKAQMEAMAAAAKAETEKKTTGIEIDGFIPDIKFATAEVLEKLSPVDKLLQEAKIHIEKKAFRQALQPIQKILTIENKHIEALYYKSLCIMNIDNEEKNIKTFQPQLDAFEALQPLQEAKLDVQMETRMQALRIKIRSQAHIKLLMQSLVVAHKFIEQPLIRLIALDPEFSFYYYFHAIIQMETNRIREAYDSIQTGMKLAKGDERRNLEPLALEIGRRLTALLLDPAIAHFRKGDYAKALKALSNIQMPFRSAKEAVLFESYLKQLSRGGVLGVFGKKKQATDVKMGGTVQERDSLQSLFVKQEITAALILLRRNQLNEAETVLYKGLSLAPDYTFIHFLIGVCKHKKGGIRLVTGRLGNIGDTISDLQTARSHVKTALNNPGLREAPALDRELEHMIGFFKSIQQEMEKHRKEVQEVNGSIKEFVAVMNIAKDGQIASIEQFDEIYSRMQKLKASCAGIAPGLLYPDNKKAMDDLQKAINKNMDVLQSLKDNIQKQQKEMETVKKGWDRFNKTMKSIEGGIKSSGQVTRIKDELQALQKEIPSLHRNVETDQSVEALKKLEDAVSKNLKDCIKLEGDIKAQEKEGPMIKEAHERFNAIMDSAKGGIQSEAQFNRILKDMKDLSKNMSQYKSKISSQAGKDVLKKLEDAIIKNLAQLETMRSSIEDSGDRKIVNDEVGFFNMIMEALNSGNMKFESYDQLKTFADIVDNKIKDVQDKYNRVSSSSARSSLSQLEDAWKKLRTQIKV